MRDLQWGSIENSDFQKTELSAYVNNRGFHGWPTGGQLNRGFHGWQLDGNSGPTRRPTRGPTRVREFQVGTELGSSLDDKSLQLAEATRIELQSSIPVLTPNLPTRPPNSHPQLDIFPFSSMHQKLPCSLLPTTITSSNHQLAL